MKNSELINQLLKLDLDAEIVVWEDKDDGMGSSYNNYEFVDSVKTQQLYRYKDSQWIDEVPRPNYHPETFVVLY